MVAIGHADCHARRVACEAAPQNGWTPLHNASKEGHLEVVEALLAKGADVQAKTNAKHEASIARACALCPSRSLMHTHG